MKTTLWLIEMTLWLIVMVLVLLSFITLTTAEVIRITGSNQNTKINSLETIRTIEGDTVTPQFAENITIRSNITDDNNTVVWANFTLANNASYHYIDNENGTQFGDYWNSTSSFVINETGTWTYNVTSADDDPTNTTSPVEQSSFEITDKVNINQDNLTAVTPRLDNLTFNFDIVTDTRRYLNFTVEHNLNGSVFTYNFNNTFFLANSTKHGYFNYTIRTKSDTPFDTYEGNLTIKRKAPFNRTWRIPITIEVAEFVGDIELTSTSDYTFSVCSAQSLARSYTATNLGNYTLSSCHLYLLDDEGTQQGSSPDEGFSLEPDNNQTVTIEYDYGASETEVMSFHINCKATPNGTRDSLTGDIPSITYKVADNCEGGGGGGDGAITTTLDSQPPAAETEKTFGDRKQELEGWQQGDGLCEKDKGETPWNSPGDCASEVFNFEEIFCSPMFECGNWEEAWFINGVVVFLSFSLLYLFVKKEDVGRLT